MILWFGNKKKKQELEEAGRAYEAEEARLLAEAAKRPKREIPGKLAEFDPTDGLERVEDDDFFGLEVEEETLEEAEVEIAREATETASEVESVETVVETVEVVEPEPVEIVSETVDPVSETIETEPRETFEPDVVETVETETVKSETKSEDPVLEPEHADKSAPGVQAEEVIDIQAETELAAEVLTNTQVEDDHVDDEDDDDFDPMAETRTEGFFAKLTSGMRRSSSKLSDGLTGLFTKQKLDDDTLEELEDLLIMSDMGASVASRVSANLAKNRFDKNVEDSEVRTVLAKEIADILRQREEIVDFSDGPRPRVVMFVGVNGSGKTTTIGKIASKLHEMGARSMLVAGDTFRAAAIEQLQVWGDRAGIPVMSKPTGADAAGLVYEAIEQAKKDDLDLVLIDTAGRLQNKEELMQELTKVIRVARKLDPDAPHDVILVLDATVGQNALQQVEAFRHTAGVTGIVMTKLDGTAKGGVLVAIANEHAIPIHFVGVGETADDLQPFSADAFARALVGMESLK